MEARWLSSFYFQMKPSTDGCSTVDEIGWGEVKGGVWQEAFFRLSFSLMLWGENQYFFLLISWFETRTSFFSLVFERRTRISFFPFQATRQKRESRLKQFLQDFSRMQFFACFWNYIVKKSFANLFKIVCLVFESENLIFWDKLEIFFIQSSISRR